MSLVLNKLTNEDIDRKIEFMAKKGIDIYQLRAQIIEDQKDFIWEKIRCGVQIQFYNEQLARIDQLIKEKEAAAQKQGV